MARHERGVYEPSDEVRVFDGAEEEDDAEGSRLPLLIVLSLLVLCAFAGVVWMAYVNGVAKGRTETPVLAAAPGPERVAPQNAGGTKVPYQGFKIYEQPAPSDDEADTAAPAAPPEQAQPPQAVKAVPPPPVAKAEPAPAVVKPAPPKPEPALKAAAAPPVTKPAPVAVKAAPPPPAPKPVPAAAKPVPPPAVTKQSSPPTPAPAASSVANGAPRTLPGVAPAPKPVAAAPAAAKGGYVLQIGAYKSQADADAAWKAYKAKHAALLAGYGADVQKADLGDKGTWYRLRIAGFADQGGAQATCDRLKSDGGGCFLGK